MLNTRQIIALKEIKNCGATTIRRLISKSKSFGADRMSDQELLEFVNYCIEDGIKGSKLKHLDKIDLTEALSKTDSMLDASNNLGIKVVSCIDEQFPKQLLSTVNENGKEDVPLFLFYKGDLSATRKRGIAIIGTREPTKEGVYASEYFGEKLAEAGYNIISGLALGCDTAGHRGALKCQDGITTAFLAHGLDTVYPSENLSLASEIVERGGLIMSEYPIGKNVNRYFLVARDRLQAALADATIVIQTGVYGGTNHAANTTLISNKPLFCVEYSNKTLMSHEKVIGNKNLVEKGAKYITSANYMDVINSCLVPDTNQSVIGKKTAENRSSELSLFPNFEG